MGLLAVALFGGLEGAAVAQDQPAVAMATAPEETDPRAIFQKVLSRYASIETYGDQGTVVSDIDTPNGKMHMEVSFTIKLQKPNRYLISWSQSNPGLATPMQAGAVWSDGTQPYLYMGITKAYAKMGDDQTALGGATGISGGAAATIPSLILSSFGKTLRGFDRLVDPKIQGSEKVDGEECYVIGGASKASREETFWISKSRWLIRQYRRSLEVPEGGVEIPLPSDDQLKATMAKMGQPVTDEGMRQMREMMQKAQETLKAGGLKGYFLETHSNIAFPSFEPKDFQFTPPEGTALKDTLFHTGP